MLQECLIRRKIAKKIQFFEKLGTSVKCKNLEFFFQKKSWSHMIPNRLIVEKCKKIFLVAAEIGGERRRRRSRRRFL